MRQVLITGGAGFFGAHLAKRFLEEGIRIRLFDRAECPFWAHKPGVEYVRGDIRDPVSVTSSLTGVDSVIHAAFASPRESVQTIQSVNVEGTRNLCTGAIAKGVRHLILISSTIVSRKQRVHPFLRKSPLTRLNMYRWSRMEAEQIVAESQDKELPFAIVRPKTFVGPMCVSAFRITFDWIRCGRPILVMGSGQNRYQLLDVRDMAEGIRLIEASEAEGIFHLGAQEFQSVREDLQSLLDHAKTGSRLKFIPGRIARATLRGLELANIVPLSEWHEMNSRGEDSVIDISRAIKELGWQPERSNEKALIASYDWYVTQMMTDEVINTRPVPLAHLVLKKLLAILFRQ